jgi:hypothetical protein
MPRCLPITIFWLGRAGLLVTSKLGFKALIRGGVDQMPKAIMRSTLLCRNAMQS